MIDAIAKISSAIEAHRAWIAKFHDAIESRVFNAFNVSLAADHNSCEFGKWLHEKSSQETFSRIDFYKISVKHMAFHMLAGEVAQMFADGKESKQIIAAISDAERASAELIDMLEETIIHLRSE